jgi:hypothetical protein
MATTTQKANKIISTSNIVSASTEKAKSVLLSTTKATSGTKDLKSLPTKPELACNVHNVSMRY